MSNLLHIKSSRNRIHQTLPSNSVGNDGDIIIATIEGRGVYLCSKVNGRWFVSNKLEELRKIEKTSIKDLKVNRLKLGNTTITKDEYDVSEGGFTLDVSGDIELNADGGDITIKDGTATHFLFNCDSTLFRMYDDANEADYFTIRIGAEGATTMSTIDADSDVAHMTLQPNGDLILDPSSQKTIINATDTLYLDGGNNTYFKEQSDDTVRLIVGGQVLFQFKEDATTSVAQSSSFLAACPVVMKDIGGVPDTPSSGYGSLYINGDSPYVKTDGGLAHPIFTGWHGSVTRIKILPHQFVEHEGTAGRQHALVEDDVSGKLGVRVSNTSAVLFTWVAIPTGYTATVVRCYADTGANLAVQCYSTDIDDGDITDIGNGDASAEVNITDVASTTTNSIIVMLTFANTTTEFYGGYITIQPS